MEDSRGLDELMRMKVAEIRVRYGACKHRRGTCCVCCGGGRLRLPNEFLINMVIAADGTLMVGTLRNVSAD